MDQQCRLPSDRGRRGGVDTREPLPPRSHLPRGQRPARLCLCHAQSPTAQGRAAARCAPSSGHG
eukprot:541435-Rhodomonas_salina.1